MHRLIAVLAALTLALAAPAYAVEADLDQPVEATQESNEEDASTSGESTDDEGAEDDGQASGSGEPSEDRANNGEDDVNCDDFTFREDAEEFFEAGGGEDEDRLDEDPGEDDGMPCETLPSREDGDNDNGSTPRGGVDSGYGPTMQDAGVSWADALPATVIGAAVTAFLLTVRRIARR